MIMIEISGSFCKQQTAFFKELRDGSAKIALEEE